MSDSSTSSEQRTPVGADAGGDSYVERIAAFKRLCAENTENMKALTSYFERTRDESQRRLDALGPRADALAGPDRDGEEGDMDEEDRNEYGKLAGAEREAKTLNTVAREMLDRLQLTTDGRGDEDQKDDKPGTE